MICDCCSKEIDGEECEECYKTRTLSFIPPSIDEYDYPTELDLQLRKIMLDSLREDTNQEDQTPDQGKN